MTRQLLVVGLPIVAALVAAAYAVGHTHGIRWMQRNGWRSWT